MDESQQANHCGFVEGFQPSLLPSTTMTSLQTSQAIPSIYLLPYLPPLSCGVLIQNQPPVLPLQPASVVKENGDILTVPQSVDFSGYVSSYQLGTLPPTFPVAGEATRYQGPREVLEMALQRREDRLRRNREAAKKSRKRRAQYLMFLESRAEELENENKMLKEYLQAFKSIYEAPLNLVLARDHIHVP